MLCADSEYGAVAEAAGTTPTELMVIRFWRAEEPFDPSAAIAGDPIKVYGNHGRWIAECPCGGAQLASQADQRFMCVECGNAYQGGAWRPVAWPDDVDVIADLLDERPTTLANFDPDQTVEDIQAENELLAAIDDALTSEGTDA
jgi:hypothetical protein